MSKSVKLTGEVNLKMDNATKTKEGCTVEQPLGRVCIDNGVARRKIDQLLENRGLGESSKVNDSTTSKQKISLVLSLKNHSVGD